jgi:hypothetical protein
MGPVARVLARTLGAPVKAGIMLVAIAVAALFGACAATQPQYRRPW